MTAQKPRVLFIGEVPKDAFKVWGTVCSLEKSEINGAVVEVIELTPEVRMVLESTEAVCADRRLLDDANCDLNWELKKKTEENTTLQQSCATLLKEKALLVEELKQMTWRIEKLTKENEALTKVVNFRK